MKTIYFDESGFTGYNLLNPDQPIFTIGSHDLSEEMSFDLLQKSFPDYRGEEFKFSRIWSRRKSRKRLVFFAECLSELIDNCFVYTCDKKFVVLTKIVDSLVEPVVHATGQDFYADGFNVKYSNMAHFAFSQFTSDEFYIELLETYQSFARKPAVETLCEMQEKFQILAQDCADYTRDFMDMIVLGAQDFERHSSLANHRGSSDIHLTTMVSSVSFWRSRFEQDFKVIHDESSHFFRQKEMWDRITSLTAKDAVVYADDVRKVVFPLRVAETIHLDSRGSPALQLSDIISGLAAKIKHPQLKDEDSILINQILEAGLKQMNSRGLHPGTMFIDGPPKDLDGPDAIDQFTDIMYPEGFDD